MYVADESKAIITSANLTDKGLFRNFEYGILIEEAAAVRTVRDDILRYATLGSPISEQQLELFAQITSDLREIAQAAQRSVKRGLRQEFNRRLAEADVEVLRARAAGRTAHAIFADAILHLLRSGPMRTVELHQHIQGIHPDLCDDSVDRVIDGQHFGKRWKHGVRTAQVYLRRAGQIERVGDHWRLVTR